MTAAEKMQEFVELEDIIPGGYIGESSSLTSAKIHEREVEEHEAKIREYEAEAAQLIAEGYPPELVEPALEKKRKFHAEFAAHGRRRAAELREQDRGRILSPREKRAKAAREKRESEAQEN